MVRSLACYKLTSDLGLSDLDEHSCDSILKLESENFYKLYILAIVIDI